MQNVYDAAHAYFGMVEYPGARHNPQIIADFATSGHGWVQDDETPWCAGFVNARLAECGIRGTGKLNARSFEAWGEGVNFADAQKGDICVFWRKDPNGPYGHVAFFDHYDADTNDVYVLGGNQGDRVSVAPYPFHRLIALRRPAAPRKTIAQSKTVQATTVAGAVSAGTAAVTAVSSLDPMVQNVAIGGTIIVALACVVIFRERLKKWAAGDR